MDERFSHPRDISQDAGAPQPADPSTPPSLDDLLAGKVAPTALTDVAGYDVPRTVSPPPSTGLVSRSVVVWLVVSALIAGALGGLGVSLAFDAWRSDSSSQLPRMPGATPVDRPEGTVAAVAAEVLPSVVSIESTFNGMRTSSGSGFIIREDGYILTNAHVIESSDGTVDVLLSSGEVMEGTVVGATSDYDLAVVKIDKDGLVPLVLGDSDSMLVGDPVIAIGSPLGLEATVTSGIVSSLNRPVTAGGGISAPAFINAIQTDAAINPGNSGGPLLNMNGEVIGVNSAIAVIPGSAQQAAGSVGLGFAIPSNQARRTAEEIIETGQATFPVIGVNLDQRYMGRGVKISEEGNELGIPGVVPGSPADLAGLNPGDIITAIDGRPVVRPDALVVAIRAKAPGEDVVLTVEAGGTTRDVVVTLTANTAVDFGNPEIAP